MKKEFKALFLDRDGVINIDHGYVHHPDQFEFMEGVFDLCRNANRLKYKIIIVTNQAGIGRGYYTEQQFYKLTNWMIQKFSEQEIDITKVYFCPFHPKHGIGNYKKESIFRKPAPGMLLQAIKEFNITPLYSIFIGDKETDIQAGISANIAFNILLNTSNSIKINTAASAIINQISQAKKYLSKKEEIN